MIIFRYLSKEICSVLLVVTLVLLFIFLSNQFVRYLSYAADGRLFSGLLLDLILLEIPTLLGLLLPLGLFLGILLAYGRLYVDNEMTVLAACGMSRIKLIAITMTVAAGVSVLAAVLTLWVAPNILALKDRLLSQANNTSIIATLLPGRFHATADGQEVFYVESMSRDHSRVKNVFVAERSRTADNEAGGEWSIFSAKGGFQFKDKQTGEQFMVNA